MQVVSATEAVSFSNEMELVKLAKTDDDAFAALYNRYFPKIYGFVLKRVGQREIAEDIVSAIFTEAFVHLENYEDRHFTFGAWLYKIATNKLIDHYRRENRRKVVAIDEISDRNLSDGAFTQASDVDRIFLTKTVSKVMNEMPEKYQKVLCLKFFSELSNGEIAAVLGVSANSAGVLLYRSLKKFKKLYESYV